MWVTIHYNAIIGSFLVAKAVACELLDSNISHKRGMVDTTLSAPEYTELLKSPKATTTISGKPRWVKDMNISWSTVLSLLMSCSDMRALKLALSQGKPTAPDMGAP